MILPILVLGVAALIASSSLFKHTRLLVYIAVSLGLWQTAWLLITLIDRTLLVAQDSAGVYTLSALVTLIAVIILARYKKPTIPLGRGRHDVLGDISCIVVTIIVLVGASVVIRANGFAENSWITHGFYNGDTATFMALTRKSFDTAGLVNQNPFAQNSSLEYPTLLHASIASLFTGGSGSWLYTLPALAYATIIMTVPLFFFLWQQARVEKTSHQILPTIIIGLVLTASWDSFIYPQSHFFLTGLFILQAGVLLQSRRQSGNSQYIYDGIAAAVAVVLLFSNAVTGTAAVALFGIHCLQRILTTKVPRERVGYALLIAFFALMYITATPGNGSLRGFGFSYTAALDMVRLTPLLILLFAGAYMERKKQIELIPGVAILSSLAFIVFLFSTRNIVVANASRFFYHGLLIGFPLMLAPLEKVWSGIKSIYTEKSITTVERLSFALISLTGLGLLLTPSLSSIAGAYDNLLFKDRQVIDTADRTALWWIEDNTAPDAVFLAAPDSPFSIPAFTGRAMLRTDYWLSPDDNVLNDVRESFTGDIAAQEQVVGLVDYILLQEDERPYFEPLPAQYENVFDSNAVVIYQVARKAATEEL